MTSNILWTIAVVDAEPLLLWTIAFIAAAVLLFVIEVFIPSGGLLGVLSFASLIGAIICLFLISSTHGWIGVLCAFVLVPVALAIALKAFPHTFIGKRLILSEQQKAASTLYSSDDTPGYADLLDARGVTLTDLRPVGTVKINDRQVECLAERGMIEAHTPVKVVAVSGIEIKVRPL